MEGSDRNGPGGSGTPDAARGPAPRPRLLVAVALLAILAGGAVLRLRTWETPSSISHLGWNRGFWGSIGRSFLRREPFEAFTRGFGAVDAGALPVDGVHVFTHHPPLTGWLSALGLGVFGNDTRGLEVPFFALGMLCILLAFSVGRRLHGPLAGLAAAAAFALLPAGAVYGTMPCEFGVPLHFGILLALRALLRIEDGAGPRADATLAFAAYWLVLTDWPAAVALAILGLHALCGRGPRWRSLSALILGAGAGAMTMLVLITRVMTLDDYVVHFRRLLGHRTGAAGGDGAPWFDVVGGYWTALFGLPLLALVALFLLSLPARLARGPRRRSDLVVAAWVAFGVVFTLYGRNIAYVHDYWALVALPGLALAGGAGLQELRRLLRARTGPGRALAGLALLVLAASVAAGFGPLRDRYAMKRERSESWQTLIGGEIRRHTRIDDVIVTPLPNHAYSPHEASRFEGLDPVLAFAADRRFLFGVATEEDLEEVIALVARSAPPGARLWILTMRGSWSGVAARRHDPPHEGLPVIPLSWGFRLLDARSLQDR